MEIQMKKQELLQSKAIDPPNFSLIDENFLKSRIYTIRGVKVMIDTDLAKIYGYSTKAFNRQVKNNIEKFDEDFRFILTKEENFEILRCKKCTLESVETDNSLHLKSKILTLEQGKYSKYLPYAFTEQGIYMLMTVLKGEQATAQSKALIRLFKQMKDYIVAENQQLLGNNGIAQIASQTVQNTHEITEVKADVRVLTGEICDIRSDLGKINIDLQKVMESFIDPSTSKHFLILDGQKLESDVAYVKIYSMAKKSITIIDNYTGVKTLDLLREVTKGISIKIISDAKGYAALTQQIQNDFTTARPDVKLKVL